MKNKYKIGLVILVSVIIICGFNALLPAKKSVVKKLLDKDKLSCGYYKQENKFIYYLYDGTTLYSTSFDSCKKLKNKDKIDSVVVIDSKKLDTAIVNSIGDDDNWYGGVDDTSKRLDKIKY